MGREEKQSYCVPPVGDLDGRRSRFKNWFPLRLHLGGECNVCVAAFSGKAPHNIQLELR